MVIGEHGTGPLNVERFRKGLGVDVIRVSGFTADELYDLRHMDYRDMKMVIIQELNKRNNRLGSQYMKHGVYHMYENQAYPDSIFIEVGTDA